MALDGRPIQLPTWSIVALLAGVGLSVVYSIVIMGSLTALLALWAAVFRAVLSFFVVYLLYQFVLAVETIAENH